jgi:hypothetical protein
MMLKFVASLESAHIKDAKIILLFVKDWVASIINLKYANDSDNRG